MLCTTSLFAQATRTWVSGVGDDVNPCSRTAPCKTWAGAISKTASGGIIDALDPGGYGALTITKPITIEGNGTLASGLASGTNGFVINITTGTNRDVVLRNLLINGSGPTLGINGVRFIAGDSLTIEDCSIENFSGSGIDFEPATNVARLNVLRTTITQNVTNGILIRPGVGGIARVSIFDTDVVKNTTGILIQDVNNPSAISVMRSRVSNNTSDGIFANSTTASGITVLVESSEVSHNGGVGLRTAGANGRIRSANNLITGNSTGLSAPAGELCTFGNNRHSGNTTQGAFTGACVPSNS
ncbi:MAG TPA: right-handed parallel beta-helix repeat-containing protein [Thermoanaerobaculia bacterium]